MWGDVCTVCAAVVPCLRLAGEGADAGEHLGRRALAEAEVASHRRLPVERAVVLGGVRPAVGAALAGRRAGRPAAGARLLHRPARLLPEAAELPVHRVALGVAELDALARAARRARGVPVVVPHADCVLRGLAEGGRRARARE